MLRLISTLFSTLQGLLLFFFWVSISSVLQLCRSPTLSLSFLRCISSFFPSSSPSIMLPGPRVFKRILCTEGWSVVITQIPLPLSQQFCSPSLLSASTFLLVPRSRHELSLSPQVNSFALLVTREVSFCLEIQLLSSKFLEDLMVLNVWFRLSFFYMLTILTF